MLQYNINLILVQNIFHISGHIIFTQLSSSNLTEK